MKLVEPLLMTVGFLHLVLLLLLVLLLKLPFRFWILVAHDRGGWHCRLERTAGGNGECQPGPREQPGVRSDGSRGLPEEIGVEAKSLD